MKQILIVLFLNGIALFLNAQSYNNDSIKGIALFNLAEENHNDYKAYVKYSEASLNYLRKCKLWEYYFESLSGLITAHFVQHNFIASDSIARIQEFELETLKPEAEIAYMTLMQLVVYYNRKSDYEKYYELCLKGLNIANHNKENVNINKELVFNNLGVVNQRLGNITDAILYFQLALETYRSTAPSNHDIPTWICGNLGNYYHSLKDLDNARKYFLKAMATINLIEEEGFRNRLKANIYKNYAVLLQTESNFDSAHYYLIQATIIPNIPLARVALTNKQLGVNYLKKGVYEKAEQVLQTALHQLQISYSDKHHHTSSGYQILSELYAMQNQFSKALDFNQHAITALIHDFSDSLNYKSNPTLDLDIISKTDLLKVLTKKGELLVELEEKDLALSTYELAIDLVYDIRKEYQSSESKLYLSENAAGIFEAALALSVDKYETTQNQEFLEKSFSISEKNKATLLLESVMDAEAKGKSSIPDSLLQFQYELKTNLALYNKAIRKLEKPGENEEQLKILKNQRFELLQSKLALGKKLEQQFPEYYQLKNELTVSTIAEVQQNLMKEAEIFVEYFYGEQNIYVFVIDRNYAGVKSIPKTKDNDVLLQDFIQMFSQPTNIQNEPKQFQQLSHQVFELLLKNDKIKMGSEFHKLIIVPDGLLNFIPFDALVMEIDSNSLFDSHQYLIHHFFSRYLYSTSLTLKQKNKTLPQHASVLAMAPIFEKQERNLETLRHSEVEFQNLHFDYLKILTGQETRLDSFYANASLFDIIHLSTHAETNTKDNPPAIHFFDSTLYLPEIFALNLTADLVVLSACQTHLGTLKKGEGVMSLARGFTFAGASSLISSLWSVKEEASALILSDFYQQLTNGLSKAESLHLAKLNYLNNNQITDYKKSPYNWAGLTHTRCG